MKRLLYFLLMMPVLTNAQNFEFGINGGISVHARPAGNRYTWQEKPVSSYYLSARANLITPRYRFGLGIDMVNIIQFNTLLYNYTYRMYNNIAKPLFAPYLFINRTFDMGTGYAYAGVLVGAAMANTGINNLQYDAAGNVQGYTTDYFFVMGYTSGIQGGLMFMLNKRLGLNTEAAVRFTDFKYNPPVPVADNRYRYRVFYFPFSAGLRYSI